VRQVTSQSLRLVRVQMFVGSAADTVTVRADVSGSNLW